MAEIAVENGRISNFEGLVTLTLDRVVLHTVVHHSTCMPDFNEIEETLWTDGHTHGRCQVHCHVTQKLGQISKIRRD